MDVDEILALVIEAHRRCDEVRGQLVRGEISGSEGITAYAVATAPLASAARLIADDDDLDCTPATEQRTVEATDGWTPLEFYAFIIRTLGMPTRFHFDGERWVGDGPFTKPVPQSILHLLEAQGV